MARTDSLLDSANGSFDKDPATIRHSELEKLDANIHFFERKQADAVRLRWDKSEELYYQLMGKYFKEYRDARLNGKPLVYVRTSTSVIPILDAMDLTSYRLNTIADLLGSAPDVRQEFLDGSTEAGLRPWVCQSLARFPWGGVVRGHVQQPDLVVSNTLECNANCAGTEFWVRSLGIPCFFLDRPRKYSEDAVQIYAKQLQNLIVWLEAQTGHKLDWDKLEEGVEYHRQYVPLQREISELRRAVPHPIRTKQACQLQTIGLLWTGRLERIEFNKVLRDEAKLHVEQKRGGVNNERLRLLTQRLPSFAYGLLDWWEQEWGAVSVAEPRISSVQVELDPKKPLESLARAEWYARGECYTVIDEEYLETCVRLAKEFSVDAMVYFEPHWCRKSALWSHTIKHALKREAGVPTLVIDVDYVDPTYFSEEQIQDKMEPFFEMLIERKGF